MTTTASYQFDIALSFAGEDRNLARQLAALLQKAGTSVFYDEYETADFWGKDLYQHLGSIYRDRAKYCLIFVSSAYASKIWTRHELKHAQARALRENEEYILPLRLDDTELPGLNETIAYIDLRHTSLNEVCTVVQQKLFHCSGWSTWPGTPTHIDEFSPQLRMAVDSVTDIACSTVIAETANARCPSPNFISSIRDCLSSINPDSATDVELTCLDSSGSFIYHPWPGIIGWTLESQWSWRAGFADWVLQQMHEMRRGYLTWKDNYASDLAVELEMAVERRQYIRRTLLGFRQVPTPSDQVWNIAVEGHEVAKLGSKKG